MVRVTENYSFGKQFLCAFMVISAVGYRPAWLFPHWTGQEG
jgi:hypothetical protein